MTEYVTDENGNRASIEFFGGKKEAEESLKTLTGCTGCMNCTGCTGCVQCTRCTGCVHCMSCANCTCCVQCMSCTNCTNCTNCTGCTDCMNCVYCFKIIDCKNPLAVGGFRSDGYQFVMGQSGSVHAGCRVFTNISLAREHWFKTRANTELGDETEVLLKFLENMRELKK